MGEYPVLKQAQPDEMLPRWKRVEEVPTLTPIVWKGPGAQRLAILCGLGRQSVVPGDPYSPKFAQEEDERVLLGPNNVVAIQ